MTTRAPRLALDHGAMPKIFDPLDYAQQKFGRWIESATSLKTGRENHSSSEPIRRMESAERNHRQQLETAIELVRETVGGMLLVPYGPPGTDFNAPSGAEGK